MSVRLFNAILLVALPMALSAQSARPSAAGPFVHSSWTVADGLPVNHIQSVLQSRDGYIWIATLDGLARFDGLRFTVYNTANSPELTNNRFTSLQETGDSSIW